MKIVGQSKTELDYSGNQSKTELDYSGNNEELRTMKPAFMEREPGRIVSEVVGDDVEPTAFVPGDTCVLQQPVDLAPLGVVPAGAAFKVEDHDPCTGLVTLRADTEYDALIRWGGVLVLQPFTTEDVIAAFNGLHACLSPLAQLLMG